MKAIAIIPARFASTRFPGKPLALINGKPMVQYVYERCCTIFEKVYVATDDARIENAVLTFGGKVVMTSADHPSGTDRCAEAAQMLSNKYDFDVVVNVQGDEPFIETEQLKQIINCFADSSTDIATLITPIHSNKILFDTNKVKAVKSTTDFALLFSRHPIPYQRDTKEDEWLNTNSYYLHLGLYAYRKHVLFEITQLEQSPLEIAEKLEQLRWIENGYRIKTTLTSHGNFGVDTPEDLENLKISNSL
ncbi:MAG: 3-deoxy-manno-octulosonate cytidylyltransferase [Prolixibacteraceae bacterium]|jgi:3-deoxy-manno-octulosonate cytidylyltransferase (CMP-KDO synthetase)|nr:3-deoxy-manno-octulosonate cytidylyltransferase [Prolixibacteraceae bacterium]